MKSTWYFSAHKSILKPFIKSSQFKFENHLKLLRIVKPFENNVVMASKAEEKNPEDQFTFDQQLSYCQLILEKKLEKERISPKAAQELLRSLKILMSEKASFIKKRQVMRVSCGDYRKDMLDLKQSTNKCMDELINNRNEVEKVDHGMCRQFSRKRAHNKTEESEAKVPPFCFNFPVPENDNH